MDLMKTTTSESRRGRTPGFKGTRNTNTSAAVQARQKYALQRKIDAAKVLLEAHGFIVTPPQS